MVHLIKLDPTALHGYTGVDPGFSKGRGGGGGNGSCRKGCALSHAKHVLPALANAGMS